MTIRWHLRKLMDEAQITYRELSSGSGVSTEILTRLINEEEPAISTRTVDRLLTALQVRIARPLAAQDLLEFVPDQPTDLTQPASVAVGTRRAQRDALPTAISLTPEEAAKAREIEERRAKLLAQAQNLYRGK